MTTPTKKTVWKKSPQALIDAFDAALPVAASDVQRRQMFGYPCAFVNGHMFTGLHEHRMIVRVPSEAASHPFVVMGRTMKDYVALEDPLELTPAQLADWVARALTYTRGLAPKAPKTAAQKTTKTAAQKAAAKTTPRPRRAKA
jgi:TfoX/Sxy family transcriptional regulator of competence genes